MNRTRLLMIGVVALALGAFVSLLVYKNVQSGAGSNTPTGEDVIVAANNIQVGAKIEEHDIKLVKMPTADLPADIFRKRSSVIGRGVVIPISKGEFVLQSKLAAENAGSGLPSLITNGMRAVSVRVNEIVSVAGFVTPDTRVDVLLTGTPVGGNEPQTTTVLQNVRVLAAGHSLERTPNGEAQNTAVITLLVTPDDAQKLTLAQNEGKIQLSLRNPLDTRQDEVAASGSKSLFKGVSSPANTAPAHPRIVVKKAPPTPAPSTGINIEVYQGDKKPEVVKFPEESPETK